MTAAEDPSDLTQKTVELLAATDVIAEHDYQAARQGSADSRSKMRKVAGWLEPVWLLAAAVLLLTIVLFVNQQHDQQNSQRHTEQLDQLIHEQITTESKLDSLREKDTSRIREIQKLTDEVYQLDLEIRRLGGTVPEADRQPSLIISPSPGARPAEGRTPVKSGGGGGRHGRPSPSPSSSSSPSPSQSPSGALCRVVPLLCS